MPTNEPNLTPPKSPSDPFYSERNLQHLEQIVQDIKNMPAARHAGRINSTKMKERGLGKIAVYVICAIVAAIGDLMMAQIGTPPWLINLVIGYLVATEALSVVENLAAAGAENMGRLLEKIHGRL